MSNRRPGEVRLKDLQISPQSSPNEMRVKIRVDPYNFDADVARSLKDEHNEKIIPALAAATYILKGSANREWRTRSQQGAFSRAEEVQKHFTSHNVGSQIIDIPLGVGDPKDGPNEDEHDRVARLNPEMEPVLIDHRSGGMKGVRQVLRFIMN